MVYLICILIYLCSLGGIAVYFAFRVRNRDDFAVAGRSLSPWVMVLTMLACWIGTGSIVGNAGKTYETGLAALFLPLGAFIGMIVLAFIARRTRNLSASSVPEIIGDRFGPVARGLAVTALVIAYLVIVSYQFNAGGAVIQVITSDIVDANTATLIAAIFIILFASLAGLMSLAYQDVITGLIITITIIVACGIYWFKAGGWSGIETSFTVMTANEKIARVFGFYPAVEHDNHMKLFGVYSGIDLINFLLPSMLLVLGDANQYQRIFASRNSRGAGIAVTTLVFVSFLVEMLIILTAWIASSQIVDSEEGKYVLIYAARDLLPLPLGCLFMVTVVGIIVSTANSFLLVPSTTFVKDVWYRMFPDKKGRKPDEIKALWINRAMVVVFGVIAYLFLQMFDPNATVFEKALFAFTVYGASITPALLAAILWKGATKYGAVSSISAGVVISLGWNELTFLREKLPGQLSQLDAVLPAMTASVLCLIVVSLLTRPKD